MAILGSLLNTVYRNHLNLSGLPKPAAHIVRDSASAGVLVGRRLGSPALVESVRSAFVDAMDATLWVCAGLALFGVVLAIAFLPARTQPAEAAAPGGQRAEASPGGHPAAGPNTGSRDSGVPVGRTAAEAGESGTVSID